MGWRRIWKAIFASGGDAGCGVGGLSEQSLYDKSKEATGEAVHAYGWGRKEDDEWGSEGWWYLCSVEVDANEWLKAYGGGLCNPELGNLFLSSILQPRNH